MSEEIDNKVEQMMRAEMHAGGVVEPGLVDLGDDGRPEIIHFPAQATVVPNTLLDNGVKINYTLNGVTTGVWNGTLYSGATYAQPWPSLHSEPVTIKSAPEPLTAEQIRTIVAETIHKVLYPESDGLVTHQHRRIRQWDETGQEWRGVLYLVEKESEM